MLCHLFTDGVCEDATMTGARITITCKTCLLELRAVVPSPLPTLTAPTHCTYCGATTVHVSQDSERDFWEVMEETFGMPRATLELFYGAWQQEPKGFVRFRDYVVDFIKSNMTKKEA